MQKTELGQHAAPVAYPESFWSRLEALDVVRPGQPTVELGVDLAPELARRGCRVVAVDPAPERIGAARRRARLENVVFELQETSWGRTGLPEGAFEAVFAGGEPPEIPEISRLLAPGGLLVTYGLRRLPLRDVIACTSEELVLKYAPRWAGAGFDGEIEPSPLWARGRFEVAAMFRYDERIPFTRAEWRAHVLSLGAVPEEAGERFDAEHARILEIVAEGEPFTVLHRIQAHVFAEAPA